MCFFREKLISRARESEPLSEGIAGRSGERYLHQNICTGRIRKTFAFSSSFPLPALSTGTPNPLTPQRRGETSRRSIGCCLPFFRGLDWGPDRVAVAIGGRGTKSSEA